MNKTLETLRVRNRELVAARKSEKTELERYKKEQKEKGKRLDGEIVTYHRNNAREDARYHHVAYSLLKGNKYSEIERSCGDKLDPDQLLSVIKECEHSYNIDEVKDLLNE